MLRITAVAIALTNAGGSGGILARPLLKNTLSRTLSVWASLLATPIAATSMYDGYRFSRPRHMRINGTKNQDSTRISLRVGLHAI
ncbi:hypothetical protein GCM10011400_40770 [Paraburkholderia caffeinilytica]|uniref:Uncharacterized protein n=1 Tax=Paraburkholderia caffeinilytica TaxID=1761016 RepID=A0ABQ1MXY5_9BURK|nr:hypothetical protein GCM10011400_40770 [Paraburkholderia caffeinilytica]CAB3787979.1 hypothetical protein LMG28690_02530 [Paraburkholderia caffeinilytica]